MLVSLGFDEILPQLSSVYTLQSSIIPDKQHIDDTHDCHGLGDFHAVWEHLSTTTSIPSSIAESEYTDNDATDNQVTQRQKKQMKKRELRKRNRRKAHEQSELGEVADLEAVPELSTDSTASETDVFTSGDESSASESRLTSLRSSLSTATKAFHATSAHRIRPKVSSQERTCNLHRKLAESLHATNLHRQQHDRLIRNVAFQSPHLPQSDSSTDDRELHIFVDSSNIYLGFQDLLQSRYPASYPAHSTTTRPHLDVGMLDTILQRGRSSRVKALVGSAPLLQSWNDAETCHYEVSILERVASGTSRRREQGVDELIHLKMMESIVDAETPGLMVLATGDANVAQFSSGFFSVVLRALSRGWIVEVWAFERSVNRLWLDRQFREANEKSFSLHYLDDYLAELES